MVATSSSRTRSIESDGKASTAGQPLGEPRVAHLAADPQREVVRIGLGQRRAVHQDGGHVAEDGLRGHALELLAQLARVVGLEGRSSRSSRQPRKTKGSTSLMRAPGLR